MLLQTNSYIVPRERRAEHARLIRRFRQALARIGCDQFEVYEQVGANWSPGGANGRYVQIMRFRDRQHQQAVQAAERNDHGAQQIISEFCDLINFPYQQQHGYFATGFYASVLPTGPRQTADLEAQDAEEAPLEGAAATVDPFADRGTPQEIDSGAEAEELQAGSDIPFDDAQEQSKEKQAGAVPVPHGHDESDAGEFELYADVADAEESTRFEEPSLETADLRFAELPISIPTVPSAIATEAIASEAMASEAIASEALASEAMAIDAPAASHATPRHSTDAYESAGPAEPGDELFESAQIAGTLDPFPGESDFPADAPADPQPLHTTSAYSDAGHQAAAEHETGEETADHEPLAAEFDLETEDLGLLFEDEAPDETLASAGPDPTVEQEFDLYEPTPRAFVRRGPPPLIPPSPASLPEVVAHHEPHEELLPPILDSFGSDHESMKVHDISPDEAGLDALLDDANLLDHVPLSALDDSPRLHSRREGAGNGHDASDEKDTDLLEFESFIRQLQEDPSADHGHLR